MPFCFSPDLNTPLSLRRGSINERVIIVLLGMLVLLVEANANYYISHHSYWGISDDAQADGWAELLPNIGDKALVQLIYVGENGVPDYDQLNIGDDSTWGGADFLLNSGGTMEGDDILLESRIYEHSIYHRPGELGQYAMFDYTADKYYFGNGKVYVRIFDTEDAAPGTKYYQGHILQARNLPSSNLTPPVPDQYNLGQNGVATVGHRALADGSGFTNDGYYVIPEPNSVLLLVTGTGILYLNRRNRLG